MSLPARGAWIEIVKRSWAVLKYSSLPARGAWIEMSRVPFCVITLTSLPARGAWIEILNFLATPRYFGVAPRKGSVD